MPDMMTLAMITLPSQGLWQKAQATEATFRALTMLHFHVHLCTNAGLFQSLYYQFYVLEQHPCQMITDRRFYIWKNKYIFVTPYMKQQWKNKHLILGMPTTKLNSMPSWKPDSPDKCTLVKTKARHKNMLYQCPSSAKPGWTLPNNWQLYTLWALGSYSLPQGWHYSQWQLASLENVDCLLAQQAGTNWKVKRGKKCLWASH